MWSTSRSSLSMSHFLLFCQLARELSHPPRRSSFNLSRLQRMPTLLRFAELKASASHSSSSLTSTKSMQQPISVLYELGDKSEQVLFSIGQLHWWNVTEFLGNYKICSRDPDSRVEVWCWIFWKYLELILISWQITQTGFMWGLLNLSYLAARGSIDAW